MNANVNRRHRKTAIESSMTKAIACGAISFSLPFLCCSFFLLRWMPCFPCLYHVFSCFLTFLTSLVVFPPFFFQFPPKYPCLCTSQPCGLSCSLQATDPKPYNFPLPVSPTHCPRSEWSKMTSLDTPASDLVTLFSMGGQGRSSKEQCVRETCGS